jgi:hypothetical protein
MTDTLITDKKVYPVPSPQQWGPAGTVLVDPTFNTKVLRVTDEQDGANCNNSYAYWPTFNKDSTRMIYTVDNAGKVCDFNPNGAMGQAVSNKRDLWAAPVPDGGLLNTEDAVWSGKSPDVIYGHLGMKIWGYNVIKKTYTLIRDLGPRIPGANQLQQMTVSSDDNAFGFNLVQRVGEQYTRVGYCAYRVSQDDLYVQMTATVDEVHIDKSGQFLMVFTGVQGATAVEAIVVNLNTKAATNIMDSAPDFCPSHHDVGKDFVVGADNWNNGFTARKLSTPHQFVNILSLGNDWSQSNHVSLLADDETWMLTSFFLINNQATPGPFRDELVLVATDGTQRVRRLLHHHSTWRGEYWNSPRADISKDGRWTTYTSNQGTQRRDVFVAQIPPVSVPTPPPQPSVPTYYITDTAGSRVGEIKIY